ncbi:MAG: DegT/DnrJ/EryC1/StrS aminotransferase family protein [Firmicutes bacterium]|nr:DegT/DnrJ/EryC1/StrS aminotransferase family protein [Bacillota bacterium]
MNIPFSPPDITEKEIELVAEALRSGWITTGPRTKEFERKIADYVGTPKTVCLNSATAAMEMTLRVLGIGEGDEVIVPAYTYTATCSVICHVGATPVIVDISKESHEMDYDNLDAYFTSRTKAIMPVDLAGIICDYERIYECIERNRSKFKANNSIQSGFGRIIVIADSAHGFGAMKDDKRAGQFADFTCFSFHAVKNLTTAEGGAVTWKSRDFIDDEELYKDYMNLSLHGQTKDALNKNKLGMWEYDITSPAYKCNMTDLQAAIGLGQLERYDEMLERRHHIINIYDTTLSAFDVKVLNHKDGQHRSSGHLYFMQVDEINEDERNRMIDAFAMKGIATNVHYKPLPMLTAYKNMGFDIKDYPNAFNAYKNEITLPLYSKLSDEQVQYIVGAMKDVLKEYRS